MNFVRFCNFYNKLRLFLQNSIEMKASWAYVLTKRTTENLKMVEPRLSMLSCSKAAKLVSELFLRKWLLLNQNWCLTQHLTIKSFGFAVSFRGISRQGSTLCSSN